MTTPTLPRSAFLPRRPLNHKERQDIVVRRDRLFALCTPAEQRRLVDVARWYAAHETRLLTRPNVLMESFEVVFHHRYLSVLYPRPPGLLTRGLALAWRAVLRVEIWRERRMRAGLVAHLATVRDEGAADELLGVVHFLLLLRVDVGMNEQSTFDRQLEALAADCVGDGRVPVARRFAAAQRCELWPREVTGWNVSRHMDLHVWRLLLQLAHEDAQAAVRVIDEHWGRRESPQLLQAMCLHDDPQLASQLATRLKPHRADFAASMLCTSIQESSYQLSRVPEPAAASLQQLMDASCLLLAEWTFATNPGLETRAALVALDHLFRFGDPAQRYWRELPPRCLALVQGLPSVEQVDWLRLLAGAVFYADRAEPVAAEALLLTEVLIRDRIASALGRAEDLDACASDICRAALGVLEDKVLSGRNRRVPAMPDHVLLRTVEPLLDDLLARAMAGEPHHALRQLVSLVCGLSGEVLARKYHARLRERFEQHARNHPDDAGLALKQLIQHCGFSQVDDEMYKKDLYRESFNLLLPVLETISLQDAAVARTGIGWSPRGDI
ncbi:hypothetical protein [Rhizobacter sp. OV335]|uniref:hypothetical protein n=1 Tax=Rhizobacter sp. OV335 TaxID=1500264 RepID=UPI001161085C|nr:hypothetical protein [Rhizobacter sp. OV335]